MSEPNPNQKIARAIEVVLSSLVLDNETARILKSHLTTQRELGRTDATPETER